jgi:hypothetical protein
LRALGLVNQHAMRMHRVALAVACLALPHSYTQQQQQ